MKPEFYSAKSEIAKLCKSPALSFKQAMGALCLIAAIALCLWTGQGLAPGSLCSRNLFLLIVGFKILTWCELPYVHPSYFLWIGMNPHEFSFSSPPSLTTQKKEHIKAIVEIMAGLTIIVIISHFGEALPESVLGIAKLLSVTFLFYFGAFRCLAIFFQRNGRGVRALMNDPYKARSLSEFWGQRWNRSFPYIMRTYVYGPIKKIAGQKVGLASAFLASGFLHELLISVPARAGYGLPTLYFLIQAIGIGFIKSPLGKQLGISKGLAGRFFMFLWLLLPLPLLFHSAFMQSVIVKSRGI